MKEMHIETIEIILLAVGISLDTFAVMSVSGAMYPRIRWQDLLKVGVIFGGWQTLAVVLSSQITQLAIHGSVIDPCQMRRTLRVLVIGILVFLGLYMLWKGQRNRDIYFEQNKPFYSEAFKITGQNAFDTMLQTTLEKLFLYAMETYALKDQAELAALTPHSIAHYYTTGIMDIVKNWCQYTGDDYDIQDLIKAYRYLVSHPLPDILDFGEN